MYLVLCDTSLNLLCLGFFKVNRRDCYLGYHFLKRLYEIAQSFVMLLKPSTSPCVISYIVFSSEGRHSAYSVNLGPDALTQVTF